MKTKRNLLQEELNKMIRNSIYLQEEENLGSDEFSAESEVVDNNLGSDDTQYADDGGSNGSIEVDVSDIVNKIEDHDNKIDGVISTINSKFGELTNMFNQMNQSIDSKMQSVKDKVSQEIKMANPTPRHKLELRSLDSAPFSLRLGDYWDRHLDNYDVDPTNNLVNGDNNSNRGGNQGCGNHQNNDYTLTDVHIQDSYDESNVMNSFNWMPY